MRLCVAIVAALALAAGAAAEVVRVHGRPTFYACAGTGRPTVVLEAGSPEVRT